MNLSLMQKGRSGSTAKSIIILIHLHILYEQLFIKNTLEKRCLRNLQLISRKNEVIVEKHSDIRIRINLHKYTPRFTYK